MGGGGGCVYFKQVRVFRNAGLPRASVGRNFVLRSVMQTSSLRSSGIPSVVSESAGCG